MELNGISIYVCFVEVERHWDLTDVFAEVLGRDRVGHEDVGSFERNGDSFVADGMACIPTLRGKAAKDGAPEF
jgi:hypothetical protein